MKSMLLLILLTISIPAFSPEQRAIILIPGERISPFEKIWTAICIVESSNNPLAYHFEENGCASVGIVQIQESRVKDFNKQTGKNYTHSDMYDVVKSKEVFMFYASKCNYRDTERISRLWNAGPNGMRYNQTKKYYLQVQKVLLSL